MHREIGGSVFICFRFAWLDRFNTRVQYARCSIGFLKPSWVVSLITLRTNVSVKIVVEIIANHHKYSAVGNRVQTERIYECCDCDFSKIRQK